MKADSSDLRAIGERFISARGDERQNEFESLVKELKAAIAAGRMEEAAAGIRFALLPDLDYSSAQALVRSLQLLTAAEGKGEDRTRIAVVGGYNTSTLVPLLELHLFGAGIYTEVYESPYGVFRQEIHDPGSPLYSFRPKTVFIATGRRDLLYLPSVGDDRAMVQDRLKRETDDWVRLWEMLHDRLGCTVIQNSFDSPYWRVLGNHDSRHPAGLSNYLSRLNLAVQDQAPPFVIIHDVGHLAAQRGLSAWGDPRFYHYAKLPCAPQYLPDYAHSVASLIAALAGGAGNALFWTSTTPCGAGSSGRTALKGFAWARVMRKARHLWRFSGT